jgi:hypothetical protein
LNVLDRLGFLFSTGESCESEMLHFITLLWTWVCSNFLIAIWNHFINHFERFNSIERWRITL